MIRALGNDNQIRLRHRKFTLVHGGYKLLRCVDTHALNLVYRGTSYAVLPRFGFLDHANRYATQTYPLKLVCFSSLILSMEQPLSSTHTCFMFFMLPEQYTDSCSYTARSGRHASLLLPSRRGRNVRKLIIASARTNTHEWRKQRPQTVH